MLRARARSQTAGQIHRAGRRRRTCPRAARRRPSACALRCRHGAAQRRASSVAGAWALAQHTPAQENGRWRFSAAHGSRAGPRTVLFACPLRSHRRKSIDESEKEKMFKNLQIPSFVKFKSQMSSCSLTRNTRQWYPFVPGWNWVPVPSPVFGLYKDLKTFVCVRFF